MALSRVQLSQEVFCVCTTHALTTETEEVMGLLLGDVHYGEDGEAVARISVAVPQIRTDRRKDRVEASPEQLASAMATAEELSEGGGPKARVIGWYHSHPHITVLPSHVDVRTQASYQMLDEGFVGIIISAFNREGADCSQQIQITAFQSVRREAAASPPVSQRSAEIVDSPMAKALAASRAEAPSWAVAEEMEQQASQQQQQWVRREMQLCIGGTAAVPGRSLGGLHALLRMLFQEESRAFQDALHAAAEGSGPVDPLTALHHTGLYQQHMCRLIETVVGPTLGALHARSGQLDVQLAQLTGMKRALQAAQQERKSRPQAPDAGTRQSAPAPLSYMDMPVPDQATVAASDAALARSMQDAHLSHGPPGASSSSSSSSAAWHQAWDDAPGPGPNRERWAQPNPAANLPSAPELPYSAAAPPDRSAPAASSKPGQHVDVLFPGLAQRVVFEGEEQLGKQSGASDRHGGFSAPYDAGIVHIAQSSSADPATSSPGGETLGLAHAAVANGNWVAGQHMQQQRRPPTDRLPSHRLDAENPANGPGRVEGGLLRESSRSEPASSGNGSEGGGEEARRGSKPMKSLLRKMNPLKKDRRPEHFADLVSELGLPRRE